MASAFIPDKTPQHGHWAITSNPFTRSLVPQLHSCVPKLCGDLIGRAVYDAFHSHGRQVLPWKLRGPHCTPEDVCMNTYLRFEQTGLAYLFDPYRGTASRLVRVVSRNEARLLSRTSTRYARDQEQSSPISTQSECPSDYAYVAECIEALRSEWDSLTTRERDALTYAHGGVFSHDARAAALHVIATRARAKLRARLTARGFSKPLW